MHTIYKLYNHDNNIYSYRARVQGNHDRCRLAIARKNNFVSKENSTTFAVEIDQCQYF